MKDIVDILHRLNPWCNLWKFSFFKYKTWKTCYIDKDKTELDFKFNKYIIEVKYNFKIPKNQKKLFSEFRKKL